MSTDLSSTLYDAAVALGIPIDSHESDLYLLATKEAWALVHLHGVSASSFVSQLDGRVWLDIPFAYLPWWRARQR